MFEEYKKEVLEFYFFKKETNQLSSNLESLGRLKLRKECLKILAEKYSKKDDEMLTLFFDPLRKYNDHVRSIENFELDKFRPLVSFLRDGTSIRDDQPVKLIAWLMDFDSYQDWRFRKETSQPDDCGFSDNGMDSEPDTGEEGEPDSDTDESSSFVGKEEADEKTTPEAQQEDCEQDASNDSRNVLEISIKRSFSIKKTLIISMVFLLLGGGVFFLLGGNTTGTARQPSVGEECMYWTGDHYEPVKCDEKINDAVLVPLNLQTLNNLRKINLMDTLTANSLGKVWYSKIGGKHEFFTDSGVHPVDTLKRLKPLTNYILNKHVSYYRYLLTRLMWSVSVIVMAILGIACVIYFLWRQKKGLKSF